jgi:hypothetical protein
VIFGQTLFQSVLERLEAERSALKEADPPKIAIKGFNSGFVAQNPHADEQETGRNIHSALNGEYLAYSMDDSERQALLSSFVTPKQAVKPPHLDRLSLAEIAADLDLQGSDTAETLARKRRKFALENHPDLVPADWRDSATLRMKLGNLLIDEALKTVSG